VPNYLQQFQELIQDWLGSLGISYSVRYFYWVAIQAAVFLGALVVARFISRKVEPKLEARLREIKGAPRLLRFLAVLLRRTTPIVFTLLLWISVFVMRELTWPSRSYLLFVAASPSWRGPWRRSIFWASCPKPSKRSTASPWSFTISA
jgi:hypothetical protein